MKHLMKKTKSRNVTELERKIAFKKSEWHEKRAKMIMSEDEGDTTTSAESDETPKTTTDSPNNNEKAKFKSTKPSSSAGATPQEDDKKQTKKKKKKRRDHLSYCYDSASSVNLNPHPSVFLKQVDYYRDSSSIKPILIHRNDTTTPKYPQKGQSSKQCNLLNIPQEHLRESKSAEKHHFKAPSTLRTSSVQNIHLQKTTTTTLSPQIFFVEKTRKKKNLTFKEPLSTEKKESFLSIHEDYDHDQDYGGFSLQNNEYAFFYDFTPQELDKIEGKSRSNPGRDEIGQEFSTWRNKTFTTIFPTEKITPQMEANNKRQQRDYDKTLEKISSAIQLPYTDTGGNPITSAFQVSDMEDYMEMLAVIALEKNQQIEGIKTRSNPEKCKLDIRGINSCKKKVTIRELTKRSFSSSIFNQLADLKESSDPDEISLERPQGLFPASDAVAISNAEVPENNNCVSHCQSKSSGQDASTQASKSSSNLESTGSLIEIDSKNELSPNQDVAISSSCSNINRMVKEVAVSDSIPSENPESISIEELKENSESERRSCTSDQTGMKIKKKSELRPILSSTGPDEASPHAVSSLQATGPATERNEPSTSGSFLRKVNSFVLTSDKRKQDDTSVSIRLENIQIRPESVNKMLRLQREILSQPSKYRDPDRFDAFDLVELDYEGMERYLKFLVFHSLLRDQQDRRRRTKASAPVSQEGNSSKEDSSSMMSLNESTSGSEGICSRIKRFLRTKISSVKFCNKQNATVRPDSESSSDDDSSQSRNEEETATTTTIGESYIRRKLLQCEIEGRDVFDSESSYTTLDIPTSAPSKIATMQEAKGTETIRQLISNSPFFANMERRSTSSENLEDPIASKRPLRNSKSATEIITDLNLKGMVLEEKTQHDTKPRDNNN